MSTASVVHGDCREVMAGMAECGALFDAVITDPPYHLTSGKKNGSGDASVNLDSPYGRSRIGTGFMNQQWDGGDVAFRPETWRRVFAVMKPGAHLLVFGGTRTFHRMACAIEDAGFELRDTVMWLYGQGFPKSLDVAKAVDAKLGATGSFGEPKSERHAGWIDLGRMRGEANDGGWQRPFMADPVQVDNAARQYLPGSPEAAQWQGWGSALKPGWEPILVCRRPLIGTVAENVLAFGTGALNIDASRIPPTEGDDPRLGGKGAWSTDKMAKNVYEGGYAGAQVASSPLGRWPANVLHDGSDEVLEAFAAFGEKPGGSYPKQRGAGGISTTGHSGQDNLEVRRTGGGTVARFFYAAKASAADRAGSKHPTVKPLALMRYLCRLVTPPGGLVLDPFAGSGTTLQAAAECGFGAVGIEQQPEYVADIERRLGEHLT